MSLEPEERQDLAGINRRARAMERWTVVALIGGWSAIAFTAAMVLAAIRRC